MQRQQLSFLLTLFCICTNAYAVQTQALPAGVKNAPTSTLQVSLGSEWVKESTYDKGLDSLTEDYYNKNLRQNLSITTLYDNDDSELNTKKMYKVNREFQSNHDTITADMPTPAANDSFQKYGFYWANSKQSGFDVYIIGDANTIYSFDYNSQSVIPKDQMDSILKSIQVCHKDNKCITAN